MVAACLTGASTAAAQGGYAQGEHPRANVPPELSARAPGPGIGGNEFSVASSSGWPSSTGTHFHSDDSGDIPTPPDLMEVGECCEGTSQEESRGLCEVDLSGQDSLASALLSVEVLQLGGLFEQPAGSFDIRAETYLGNNVEEITDYGASATATLGTFFTGGLNVGDVVSFDVTSEFNSAIGNNEVALGVLLRPASSPAGAALVFGNCAIAPEAPALPGPWLAVLLLVLLVSTTVVLRRRQRSG